MAYEDLTLTQKNYCTLTSRDEAECVSFFDSINNRDPEYNDLSYEQKSQCSILKVSNTDCLVYWIGDNNGAPAGTLPHVPDYNDLNQAQKDYCDNLGIEDGACATLFFDNKYYSTLTDAQKDYCELNGLSKSECTLHYLTYKKSDESLDDDMNNSLENQNNQILYFDDVAFQNSTLKTKNTLKSSSNPVVAYTVLNTEKDLQNVSETIAQRLGYKYYQANNLGIKDYDYFFRAITKSEPELANIQMEKSYQTTKWITLNSVENQDMEINELVFNFEAANGIFTAADDGGFLPNSVSVRIEIAGWDKSYSRYRTYSGSATLATPASIIAGGGGKSGKGDKGSKGTHPGKQPIRVSVYVPVAPGYYQVRIIRNKAHSYNNAKISDSFTIKRVVAIYNSNPSYKDISLLAVKVSSNNQFSPSSALSINALVRKRSTIKDSYFPYQLTLRDFIIDLWTNKKTGLGLSVNDLDIRVDLQENCNLVLDQQDNAFSVISDVLNSFGYVIYPHNNAYIIDIDGVRLERSYVFHEGNYKDISFNYNIPQNLEDGDGVRVKYLKQGMKDLTDFTYPINATNPREAILRGVSHPAIAEATAKRMHKKSKMRGKTCTITTDLEGLIPELNSRVAVSSKYLKNTITSSISKVEIITEENEVKTKVFLPDFVEFQSKYKKCMILTKDLKGNERYSIQSSDERRNYVIINQYLDVNPDHIVVIGEEDEFLEDYIVEIITPEQDGEGNITSVKLNLIEYNPEVYT